MSVPRLGLRPDEFDQALPLFPDALRERAGTLRPRLFGPQCPDCPDLTDPIQLAVAAARYDEYAGAEQLIAAAERLAAAHACPPSTAAATMARERSAGGRGRVARWARYTEDLVAATDASWKRRCAGLGYVVTDGRFGLRGRPTDPLDPTGPSRVLINELRAVEFLLSGFAEPTERLTVLLDSRIALSYLRRWGAGDTTAMPAGYNLRPRSSGRPPTLVRLAHAVADRPDLTFEHVRSHTGHLLNEAADALCSMGRRRVEERFDAVSRAHSLVDAFLADWHASSAVRR